MLSLPIFHSRLRHEETRHLVLLWCWYVFHRVQARVPTRSLTMPLDSLEDSPAALSPLSVARDAPKVIKALYGLRCALASLIVRLSHGDLPPV